MADPSPSLAHRSKRRGSQRFRWWLLGIAPVLILAGAGIVVEPLLHPLPSPTAEQTVPAAFNIPGIPPVLPWPASGQAAVEVDGVGSLGGSRAAAAVPIASVAKVMTAYVVLSGHPLTAGQEGPTMRVTSQQAAAYPQEAARGESVIKLTSGAAFTERQALQALLLSSANNMARVLAAWDAGAVSAFVTKMNATAVALGMANTRYTDPSGFDAATVSTAADQVRLARNAMVLPAFAEIVAQPTATVPVAGAIANYNTLLGQDGVVGVKTGSTNAAGGCFVFAARVTVGTASLTVFGAVFGQPGTDTPQQLTAVLQASQLLVRGARNALAVHTVVHAGQQVAAVHGPLGTATTLSAAEDVNVIGWPGLAVTLDANIPPVPARLPAGTAHGRLTVKAGDAPPADTGLRSDAGLEPPSLWTRIVRRA